VNSGNIKTAPINSNLEGLDAWASKLDQWGTKLNELKSKPTNSPLSAPTLGLPSKTQGLDFNDTRAVQQWLTNNGFNTKGVDGMYGANTKAAIDELLSSNKFVLTQAEKEAFRNFQNNATFVRAKQPAKVETPAQPVVNNPIVTPTVVDPEKQRRIDAYTKAGYIER
jgi:peptidoglycan hydrolase-like protein with peptidoglycan-binding domain